MMAQVSRLATLLGLGEPPSRIIMASVDRSTHPSPARDCAGIDGTFLTRQRPFIDCPASAPLPGAINFQGGLILSGSMG
jgi:hypothetical protein